MFLQLPYFFALFYDLIQKCQVLTSCNHTCISCTNYKIQPILPNFTVKPHLIMTKKQSLNKPFYIDKILALLLLIIFFQSCQKDCSDPATCHTYTDNTCEKARDRNSPIIADLKNYISPITGSQPDLPKAELAGMDATIEKAYFVGLGEATHGTLEFFEMKDRLFRYLVEEHGFKAIGFEATWGGALHVNRYVVDGIGSAKESVRRMQFWTWQTEEVVALVEWMHTYNLDKADEDKIYFYGFDVQSGTEEVDLVDEYLHRIAPELVEEIVPKLAALVDAIGRDWERYKAMPGTTKLDLRNGVITALSTFESNATTLIESSSEKEYELVKHAFTIIQQFEDQANDDIFTSGKRDFYMARNSEWIRDYIGGDAKIALWAHNGHVSKGVRLAQGTELAAVHGEAYQVIGFTFSTGSFQAVQSGRGLTTDNEVLEVNCLTTNALLSDTGVDNFYLVFDDLPEQSSAKTYFSSANRVFSLGALFEPENPNRFIYSKVLSEEFDILIHFDDTRSAVPY